MAGVHYTILRKTTIQLPTLSSGTFNFPPLVQFLDSLGWVSGTLEIRLHSHTISGSGTAEVRCYIANMMVGDDDPTVFTQMGSNITDVQIWAPGTNAPKLIAGKIPTTEPIGRYVGVFLFVNSGGAAFSGTVTLSVDLVARDA